MFCLFPHLVYATPHLLFSGFCSYLVWWLGMMWGCAYYTNLMVGWLVLSELRPFMLKIKSTSCFVCSNILRITDYLSFRGFCSYLVWWLDMVWGCAYNTNFMVGCFLAELYLFMLKIESHILCTELLIYLHIWYDALT